MRREGLRRTRGDGNGGGGERASQGAPTKWKTYLKPYHVPRVISCVLQRDGRVRRHACTHAGSEATTPRRAVRHHVPSQAQRS